MGTLGGTYSTALGVNDSGYVTGYSETFGDSDWHAFYYDGSSMKDLGTLGGSNSYALGINGDGHIVGYSQVSGNTATHAFYYDGFTMQDLGTLGGNSSGAFDINDNGIIVGYSQVTGNSEIHAMLFDGNAMHDLGTLGGGKCLAQGINLDGQVVGYAEVSKSVYRAFLHDGKSMLDLNDLLSNDSGWELQSAKDINNSGQIVGVGYIDGERHAFLMTPVAVNMEPFADAGENQTVYAWVDGLAEVHLDGTGSYDPDGDGLEYLWYDANELIATGAEPNVLFGVGEYEVTLIVNDGTEDSEPNSCVVTVLPAIETEAKLTPQALNRKSKQPHVIGRLELTGLTAADIDPNEMMVLVPGNIVANRIDILPANDGADSITLKGFFDHTALMDAITESGDVEIVIAAKLISGQWVYGRDVVKVK